MATASKRTASNKPPDGTRKILKKNLKHCRRYGGFKIREVILLFPARLLWNIPSTTFWEEYWQLDQVQTEVPRWQKG